MQLGEEDGDDKPTKSSERKRINKFENSQYYLVPLSSDDPDGTNQQLIDSQPQTNTSNSNDVQIINENDVNFSVNDLNHMANIKKK